MVSFEELPDDVPEVKPEVIEEIKESVPNLKLGGESQLGTREFLAWFFPIQAR
jgi:hypothetical protein